LIAGVTPAERLLKLYDEKWGKNIDPIFDELLY
jgi:glutamate--cysteine ligase